MLGRLNLGEKMELGMEDWPQTRHRQHSIMSKVWRNQHSILIQQFMLNINQILFKVTHVSLFVEVRYGDGIKEVGLYIKNETQSS